MSIRVWIVDAFADTPFTGNPAGVCVLASEPPREWMQRVALELAHSETAFLWPETTPPCRVWQLRWFTPTVEVDLCGHATLAATHLLWEEGLVPADGRLEFLTRGGSLAASHRGDGWITLELPLDEPQPVTCSGEIAMALGVRTLVAARARYDDLVEVESPEIVRRLAPDLARLAQITRRGIAVTAQADEEGIDFVSRFFAPAAGIPEDPVTGSAHCFLAPWWQHRLGRPRDSLLVGRQLSRRGGLVRCQIQGQHVRLAGRAITTLRGELLGVGAGIQTL